MIPQVVPRASMLKVGQVGGARVTYFYFFPPLCVHYNYLEVLSIAILTVQLVPPELRGFR